MPIILLLFYLTNVVLRNVHGDLEHDIPRRSILSRRAIDGTRGRKYFDPEEEGSFDSYGSAGGQYDRYKEKQDHSDIRMNVPGEPGVDYPAYTMLPQTGFSCERRSRGYYADEVAGCQVFHVCHDILVSSFLCPIGSIFSQKLLTCDWWNKVDCSMTRKFIEINRDDYNQEDDDELIRKAYGMMGLQTGMDVTSDELVDPDRGGRIIDRVTIESTGNDLPSYHDHLSRFMTEPRFLPDYEEQSERSRTSTSYQNSFYNKNYQARPSPYQDSPIFHIRKIGEDDYREPTRYRHFKDDGTQGNTGKNINEFQPSYAPTVPTVTTTTRRFYSPTIPTTYRPSTLAYNKFDLSIESSEHLYTHSERDRSFFVTPTDSESNSEFESRISTKGNYNDSNAHGDRVDGDELSSNSHRVQVKRIDLHGDRTKDSFDLPNENPFSDYDLDSHSSANTDVSIVEEYPDDIETKASIGLAQAFNGSKKFRIHVQDPEDAPRIKDDKKEHGSSFLLPNRDNSYITETTNIFNLTEALQTSGRSVDQPETETAVAINYNRTRGYVLGDNIFEESTTPVADHQKDHSKKIKEFSTTTLSYGENSRSENIFKEGPTSTAKVSKPSDESSYPTQEPHVFTNDPYYSVPRTDIYSSDLRPDIVLKPPIANPLGEFRINIPDYPSTATVPALQAHYSIPYRTEVQSSTQLPGDEDLSQKRNTSDLIPPFATNKDPSIEENVRGSLLQTLVGLSKNTDRIDSTLKPPERYEERKFVVLSNGSVSFEDRNDFPYGVSSTVKEVDSSTIGPLISQEDKEKRENSAPDRSQQIEFVRSIEEATSHETTIGSLLSSPSFTDTSETVRNTKSSSFTVHPDLLYRINDTAPSSYETIDFSSDRNKEKSGVSVSNNANALSLLQLMAELFKIDNIPRPFALNGHQSVKSRSSGDQEYWDKKETGTIVESSGIPFDTDLEDLSRQRDSLDVEITPRNLLKDQRVGIDEPKPATKEIDRSLYDIDNQRSIYQLPHLERSFTFKESKELEEPSVSLPTPSTAKFFTPQTISTTESVKTIVETEFVPSIGFSFDTDEGRQKYVDAVLGGLLHEPINYNSGTNESAKVETTESSSTNRSATQL
ncbi:hypothetical protein KPH14_003997 [Odynerus spinipes]|uniref:Chitin-binding type-2 domain-containing protein n=1 Tax=Odynerus spinipes TaxID=1348599 RepID=A0AAD9RZ79_9HYME|nr:hypothetical protein KPH14_003997 [Odynerus spinipes]